MSCFSCHRIVLLVVVTSFLFGIPSSLCPFIALSYVFELICWITRWLSGSDLKKVALFGCPSNARKPVFAAKRLRKFFEVQEDTVSQLSLTYSPVINSNLTLIINLKTYSITFFCCHQVCSKCVLKQSCKFVNQNVWKNDTKKLVLTDVMNVITLYGLECVPPQLAVPDEIKASVGRLINEVIKLSQTTS